MKEDELYIPRCFTHVPELAREAAAAGVDLELLADNLKKSPEDRIRNFMGTLAAIEVLRSAKRVE